MSSHDFEPVFSPDAARLVLRHEEAKYRMITAAYGVILARSKSELMDYLRSNPAKRQQAPELLAWLTKYGSGEGAEAELLRGAAVRLTIALKELGALPSVH